MAPPKLPFSLVLIQLPEASRFLPKGFLEYWIRMPPRSDVLSTAPCHAGSGSEPRSQHPAALLFFHAVHMRGTQAAVVRRVGAREGVLTCWELCTAMAVVTSLNSTKHVMERAPRTSFSCRKPAQGTSESHPWPEILRLPLPHTSPTARGRDVQRHSCASGSHSNADAASKGVMFPEQPRTRLVLEDASQLVLAGVLTEVANEQRVAGRIVLCVCDWSIAPRMHRHLQQDIFR